MEYPRGSLAVAATASPRESRHRPRHPLSNVAYVTIDQGNGGIVRDVSELGMALQSVAPLHIKQEVQLRFQLLGPKAIIECPGRVCWASPSGQAGVEFIGLPHLSIQLLKDWLLTQLLIRAQHICGRLTMFNVEEYGSAVAISGAARPPISVVEIDNLGNLSSIEKQRVQLPWIPFSFSVSTLAAIVDGLILFAAVLLFATLTLAMLHTIPAWPWSGVLALATSALFGGVYWFLFVGKGGLTPGMYLAEVATREEDSSAIEEPRTRFR